jgi:hypothetical protein
MDAEAPLSLDEILALLGDAAGANGVSRDDAIARYLSAGDGWKEAEKQLGGAFAGHGLGLRERKGD